MLHPKVKDWINLFKSMTTVYTIYRRPSLDIATHTD